MRYALFCMVCPSLWKAILGRYLNMDRVYRTTRGDYREGLNRNRETYSVDGSRNNYSASLVGEERGYVLGVEDERKKFREKMSKLIAKLKARGYPIMDIAEDTGYTLEEIQVM